MDLYKTELVTKEVDTMLEKGAIVKVKPEKGQFLSTIFLREKKEPGKFQPIINLRQLNKNVPIPKVQNGVPKRSKESAEGKGLHGENRFKRCIFHSSTQSGIREICEVSMERESVRVHLSHVRARSLPTDLHKITEDSNNNSKEVEHKVDNLHRRHANNGVFDVRNTHGQGHNAIFTGSTRVCDQLRKVCVDTINSDEVSGNPHKQPNHDINNTTRENEKTSLLMSKDSRLKIYNSQRTSSSGRKVTSDSASIHPSPPPVTKSPKATEGIPTNKHVIQDSNYPEEGSMPGTALVDKEYCSIQWKEITIRNPEMIISSDASLRGWGAASQGRSTGGTWGERGEIPTHKSTRIEGSGSCNKDFHQEQTSQSDSHANRQYMHPSLPNKYGRGKEPSDDQHSKIDLVISPQQGNNMHGRVYTLGTQCGGGQGIQSCGFQRLETRSKNIPENLRSPRISNGGPICIPIEPPNKQIHKLEAGSDKHSFQLKFYGKAIGKNESTWQKHYHKPILTSSESFKILFSTALNEDDPAERPCKLQVQSAE